MTNIPDAYDDLFFGLINKKMGETDFASFFACKEIKDNGKKKRIWLLNDPDNNRQRVYELLKSHGYYDLTIRKMIRFIADKQGAHLENKDSIWIHAANQGEEVENSAISVFASQMVYAAVNQIKELAPCCAYNTLRSGVFE